MVGIRLDNVSVSYFIHGSRKSNTAGDLSIGAEIRSKGRFLEIRALQNISITMNPGDRVGLVGINGSGKSTLLKVCARCLSAQSGTVEIEGSICPQFSLASGMRPTLSGRGNAILKCLYHGVSLRQIPERTEAIKELSGLGEYFELPMKTYSAGMRSRLTMSLMIIMSGDIVILDEWISVADASIHEVANKLQSNLLHSASILVAASHSQKVLREWTDRLIWLNNSEVMEDGPIEPVMKAYQKFVKESA